MSKVWAPEYLAGIGMKGSRGSGGGVSGGEVTGAATADEETAEVVVRDCRGTSAVPRSLLSRLMLADSCCSLHNSSQCRIMLTNQYSLRRNRLFDLLNLRQVHRGQIVLLCSEPIGGPM